MAAADEPTTTTRSFVLGMLDHDGRLHAATAYDVGDALGFTVHQIRLCLARLVREGVLEQEGRGRRAVFTETSDQHRRSAPEVDYLRLAYAQDAGLAPWDSRWHVVAFTIEEERRHLRNQLRELLLSMGAATSLGGTYLQATDWTAAVRQAAQDLGVEDRVTMLSTEELSVGGRTHPVEIARALWPLDEIDRAYRSFVEAHADQQIDDDDPAAAIAAGLQVVAAFERCIRTDPLLPPELLPEDWNGRAARRVLRETSDVLGRLREQAGVPQLFARYDEVFDG